MNKNKNYFNGKNSLAWYKLHSGSLWFIRHPSVAQTRLLRPCSVSTVINQEAHGATAGSVADPSPISPIPSLTHV